MSEKGKISSEVLRETIQEDLDRIAKEHPQLGFSPNVYDEEYKTRDEQEDPFNPPQPDVLPAGGRVDGSVAPGAASTEDAPDPKDSTDSEASTEGPAKAKTDTIDWLGSTAVDIVDLHHPQ